MNFKSIYSIISVVTVTLAFTSVAISTNPRPSSELIVGTYNYVTVENFIPYLKAVGVNFFLRHLASLARPEIDISKSCEASDDEVS